MVINYSPVDKNTIDFDGVFTYCNTYAQSSTISNFNAIFILIVIEKLLYYIQ